MEDCSPSKFLLTLYVDLVPIFEYSYHVTLLHADGELSGKSAGIVLLLSLLGHVLLVWVAHAVPVGEYCHA